MAKSQSESDIEYESDWQSVSGSYADSDSSNDSESDSGSHYCGGDPIDSDSVADSDSDIDATDRINLIVETLKAEVSDDPDNYHAHVEYIRALDAVLENSEKRQARETMSNMFPLTPDLWRDWIADEISFGRRPVDFPYIEKLYERGVSDYLSVDLWLDYTNFLQKNDPLVCECSPDGISKMRNMFERALAASVLHCTEADRIFEAYISYEQAIFTTLGEKNAEARQKQTQRIRNLFFRQMSVPLRGLEKTMVEYKAWEARQRSSAKLPYRVRSAYEKALEMMKARNHFEEAISHYDNLNIKRLQAFMTYLNFEKLSKDNPARVQVLYERAITEFPISRDLWIDYTLYMDATLKNSSIVRDVYSRSVRNCPWISDLWIRYLLYLERVRASDEEITKVFTKSLDCEFSSSDEYIDICLTRVDGLRRNFSQGKMKGAAALSEIRETLQLITDDFSENSQGTKITQKMLWLYRYCADLELRLGNDKAAARAVWESLLKISGSMLEAWQGYIDMEIKAGHIAEARSLYERCYTMTFSGTGCKDICHLWLCFEREYGSLEDLDLAVLKVNAHKEELKLFRMQQDRKTPGVNDLQENPAKKTVGKKRKLQSNASDNVSPAKRAKDASGNPKKTKEKVKKQEAGSSGNTNHL